MKIACNVLSQVTGLCGGDAQVSLHHLGSKSKVVFVISLVPEDLNFANWPHNNNHCKNAIMWLNPNQLSEKFNICFKRRDYKQTTAELKIDKRAIFMYSFVRKAGSTCLCGMTLRILSWCFAGVREGMPVDVVTGWNECKIWHHVGGVSRHPLSSSTLQIKLSPCCVFPTLFPCLAVVPRPFCFRLAFIFVLSMC